MECLKQGGLLMKKLTGKKNPFAKECTNCIKNIWDSINLQADSLNKQCYPNTYIWIEKFKDDSI